MPRPGRRWAGEVWRGRLGTLGGAAILVAVLAVVGPGAAVEAVASLDAATLAAGAAVAAVTTVCAAWRWRVVAHRLGAGLAMRPAVADCYRAQFLNLTLPGGVLGDVGRGVAHGRAVADVGRGLRAVAWERSLGQVALALATAAALLATGWPGVPWSGAPASVPVVVVAALAVAVPVGVVVARRAGWARRLTRAVAQDVRALAAPGVLVRTLGISFVVVAGHVATFALAARAVGVPLDAATLVPVALVVLLVAGLPVNVAGWGPREGAAAWAFAATGLDAAQGLAVAVAYGAITVVATAPGAVLLVLGGLRRPGPVAAAAVPRGGVLGG